MQTTAGTGRATSTQRRERQRQRWREAAWRRDVDPETATVAEVFRAACLSEQEQHVVGERLTGRSYGDIAADAAMRKQRGGLYSRQRVKQLEQDALDKLGLPASLDECVHADERVERGLALRERGRLVRAGDLHLNPRTTRQLRRQQHTAWELRHEEMVARFLASV